MNDNLEAAKKMKKKVRKKIKKNKKKIGNKKIHFFFSQKVAIVHAKGTA